MLLIKNKLKRNLFGCSGINNKLYSKVNRENKYCEEVTVSFSGHRGYRYSLMQFKHQITYNSFSGEDDWITKSNSRCIK